MNYLGHAYLSFAQQGIIAGNIAGDYIKGTQHLALLPEQIALGVRLHRFIDLYTDKHIAGKRAAVFFKAPYGRYAPAVVDTVMDHFLANDPHAFANEIALNDFAQHTYSLVEKDLNHLPQQFQQVFVYMKQQNWLYGYHSVKGMEKSLQGLARRAKYIPDIHEAYRIFIGHYYELNQCYLELIDDVKSAVKVELSKMPSV